MKKRFEFWWHLEDRRGKEMGSSLIDRQAWRWERDWSGFQIACSMFPHFSRPPLCIQPASLVPLTGQALFVSWALIQ